MGSRKRIGIVLGMAWLASAMAMKAVAAAPVEVLPAECASTGPTSIALQGVSGALVATDISASVQGFASAKATRLYSLHNALDRAVRTALESTGHKGQVRRCLLGEQLDCKGSPALRAFDQPATYRAKESRLDRLFSAKVSATGEIVTNVGSPGLATNEKPRDLLDTQLVSVLVTDGMEVQAAGSGGGPCLGGADPECMVSLLQARVRAGYGVWLAIAYLPFNGVHYAERPLDETHWRRIKDHVEKLTADPRLGSVKFVARRRDSKSPFSSFEFSGVKPLLLMVFSRDAEVGRALVRNLEAGLLEERVIVPVKALFVVELAPLPREVLQVNRIGLLPGAKADRIRPIVSKRSGPFFDYLVEADRGSVAPLRISWQPGAAAPLSSGITRSLAVVALGGTLPPANVRTGSVTKDGFDVEVTTDRLKEGASFQWLGIRSQLSMESAAGVWSELSADNSFEAPERLYGLKEIARGVLDTVASHPMTLDCIRLRLERK